MLLIVDTDWWLFATKTSLIILAIFIVPDMFVRVREQFPLSSTDPLTPVGSVWVLFQTCTDVSEEIGKIIRDYDSAKIFSPISSLQTYAIYQIRLVAISAWVTSSCEIISVWTILLRAVHPSFKRNASQLDETWKSLEGSFEHEHALLVKAQTNSYAWKCMYTYCLGMRNQTNLSVSVLRENQVAVIESWGWQTATMHSVSSRIRVASKATRRNCYYHKFY